MNYSFVNVETAGEPVRHPIAQRLFTVYVTSHVIRRRERLRTRHVNLSVFFVLVCLLSKMIDGGDRLLSANRRWIIFIPQDDDRFSCRSLECRLIKVYHSR
jgi:hypothetical protein